MEINSNNASTIYQGRIKSKYKVQLDVHSHTRLYRCYYIKLYYNVYITVQ